MLYHGTILDGLHVIKANASSHVSGKPVAYFTEDRCYALVCCRGRGENFVTMGLREDGKQHYYERFPNQLEVLYRGKRGFLYSPAAEAKGLKNTKERTWESELDVPVRLCEAVEDVCSEILKEEKAGRIVIHRYSEIDPAEQKIHARYVKEHMDEEGEEMKQFYLAHFASLWS